MCRPELVKFTWDKFDGQECANQNLSNLHRTIQRAVPDIDIADTLHTFMCENEYHDRRIQQHSLQQADSGLETKRSHGLRLAQPART